MALLQKLINALTIIASVAFLFYLNSSIADVSKQEIEILELTSLIGNGVALSDAQVESMNSIVANKWKERKENTPLCFLKAYQEVVLRNKLNPENIFSIFEQGKQFSGIQTCTHYYSLLTYRASRLEGKEQPKVEAIINDLLKEQLDKQKQSPVCLYFYAYGSEITAKTQIAQIIAQEYTPSSVVVNIDGSKDNTHMFVKYMLEERKDTSHKVQIHNESQRQGFIKNFEKIVQDKCSSDSIVLVIDKNSALLSRHSLRIINNYLASSGREIAVFKSLTIGHDNIEDSSAANFPNSYPVLAIKRSKLSEITPHIIKISEAIKEGSSLINYQHELLLFKLLADPRLSGQIGFSNEAIISRQARRPMQQEALANQIQKK